MPPRIILAAECHVDTALAHALVRGQRKLVEHIKGVPKLGKRLNDLAEAKAELLVIGLVDNDKDLFERPGVKLFRHQWLPEYTFEEHAFQIFTCADRPTHFLVVLEPACDKWLYLAATAAQVPLGSGPEQMPAEWLPFKEITKRQAADENPRLINLLKQLRRQPSPAFRLLLSFVEAKSKEAGLQDW